MRLVVNLAGDAANGRLAASGLVDRRFIYGGERNLYELAFGAAAGGYEVELRGWIDRATFGRLRDELDVAPKVGLPARLPDADDLVVVPEGWKDPVEYARLVLSPARLALFVLAAPGLFGWPFVESDWTLPDPLTVPLDAVARPQSFQAMEGVGFALLTHSPGIAAAAEAAGARCAFVGTGRPKPPTAPEGATRTVDAVAVMANRWAPLVREVVRDLDGIEVDLIEESANEEVIARFARARVLIWPSRIEGHATIPWEARSVGCVPVALASNRFAVGLDEASGSVVVDRLDDIAPAIRSVLGDEGRWRELSGRALATAPAEVDWQAFVDRVGRFIASVPPAGPRNHAMGGMGRALTRWTDALADRAQRARELDAELDRVRADRDALFGELSELRAEHQRVRADRDELAGYKAEEQRVRTDRDLLAQRLAELEDSRAVKLALRMNRLGPRREP